MTTVGEVGERELVERIRRALPATAPGLVQGPGDDAAVVEAPGGRIVLTTDSQHQGVHFRREQVDGLDVGWRVLAINVSDVIAMGARPTWAVCALAVPADLDAGWIDDFMAGLGQASAELGCVLVGGDVARSHGGIVATVTALGSLPPGREAIRRDGARAGHGCWVSGWPGRSAAGRALLDAGWRLGRDGAVAAPSGAPTIADASACLQAHLRPRPRVELAEALGAARLAAAAIDISDGVGVDLERLCGASGVGVTIDADALPRQGVASVAAALDRQADRWILGGGEDYELLLAVEPEREAALQRRADALRVPLHRLGRFREERSTTLRRGSERLPLADGWDHFRGGGDQ